MGASKPLLRLAGRRCIEYVVEALRPVTRRILLVGSAPGLDFLGLRQIPDLRPGRGPLAGLEAGLAASRTRRHLVVAADMPCLVPAFLERLLDGLEGFDACVPRSGGRLHPLCAAYDRSALGPIRRALDEGTSRVTDLLGRIAWRPLDLDATAAAGEPEDREVLLNMNSPADIERARRRLSRRGVT